MVEFFATVGITLSSVMLFAYWFRYTCMLILSARTARDYAFQVATEKGLSFLAVQTELREPAASDLDRLHNLLDRDYAVIARLLTHVSGSSVENRMLAIDYRLASAWYRVSNRFAVQSARQALQEMSMVVAHFANSIGESAVSAAAA